MATATKIAPPPSADAAIFTLDEAAAYLRISRGTLNKLRRSDPTFPEASIVAGLPRMLRKKLDAWIASLPTGWGMRRGTRRTAETEGR